MTGADPSVLHLRRRLALLAEDVRRAVRRRRSLVDEGEDLIDGLPFDVASALRSFDEEGTSERADGAERRVEIEREADRWATDGADLRLRRLRTSFGLAPLDVDVLLVALAPDLDVRFEHLFGFLHGDLRQRRATIGLALELTGQSGLDAGPRSRLLPGAPLVEGRLIEVASTDRPFLGRSLRVPDRVAAHLLGDDEPPPSIRRFLRRPGLHPVGQVAEVAAALRAGVRFVHLRHRGDDSALTTAAHAFRQAGLRPLPLDVSGLAESDAAEQVGDILREARLRNLGLVLGPVHELPPPVVADLLHTRWPTILYGRSRWDPSWSAAVPLQLELPDLSMSERTALWAEELGTDTVLPATLRLTPHQIHRAVVAGRLLATVEGDEAPGPEHLRIGALQQSAIAIDRLAQRIVPSVGWDDLVVPDATAEELHTLALRAEQRAAILDEWGFRRGTRGEPVVALFVGPSGTGKTLAAEVLAGELGLDLYSINLATMVDKYIGETEKNLERVFDAAERVNGVLFFDEADALFGKRSDVSDAKDRYANIEVAYLLQRLESFEGLAILATNLRGNVDDAFIRRLSDVIEFPLPEAGQRQRLWQMYLADVPVDDDVDPVECATAFDLSGAGIRNACLLAATFAISEHRGVTRADLDRAAAVEYRKAGILPTLAGSGSSR